MRPLWRGDFLLQLQGVGADQVDGWRHLPSGCARSRGRHRPPPDEGVAQVVAGSQGAVGVTAIEGVDVGCVGDALLLGKGDERLVIS